jgi:hypothetical protein
MEVLERHLPAAAVGARTERRNRQSHCHRHSRESSAGLIGRGFFQQLGLLEHPRWREVSVVTVGPMFSPQTQKTEVVETFRQDIQQMIKSGWLDASSEFTQEVTTILGVLNQNSVGQPVLKSPPRTTTESAIAVALEGSLGIVRKSQ